MGEKLFNYTLGIPWGPLGLILVQNPDWKRLEQKQFPMLQEQKVGEKKAVSLMLRDQKGGKDIRDSHLPDWHINLEHLL